jgi:hypothetical protein
MVVDLYDEPMAETPPKPVLEDESESKHHSDVSIELESYIYPSDEDRLA